MYLNSVPILDKSFQMHNEDEAFNDYNDINEFISSTPINEFNCPKPLIWSTGALTEDMLCIEKCCLPCPFSNNFYPVGELDTAYKIFAIFGIISFFLMIILSMFFYLLPSQKSNPTVRKIILPLILSVCYFEFGEFFTLQQSKSQCNSSLQAATVKDNKYCATQAFFSTGGAYALACCSSMLMIHLHLITVWNSDFVIRNIRYFNIFIFLSSLAASLIPLLMNRIEPDHICFIRSQDVGTFYTFLSFIYIAFFAHLMTFVYMLKTTISARITVNKDKHASYTSYTFSCAKNIITVQWRSLLGALLMLVVYTINWTYYLNIPNGASKWSRDWFECLLKNNSDNSQNICVHHMKHYVPSFFWTIILLFFNRCLGIMIFIIFAAKKCVFLETWSLISGTPFNEREEDFEGKTLRNVKSSSYINGMSIIDGMSSNGSTTNEVTKNPTLI